jgi:hypothetical protein
MNKLILKTLCIVLGVAIGLSTQNIIFAVELTSEDLSDNVIEEKNLFSSNH